MRKNALALCAVLSSADGGWIVRIKYLDSAAVCISEQAADFFAEICSAVDHSQQNAFDLQLRIDLSANFRNRLEQLFQTFG